MVSTRGVRYKFSEGERVLCYEPDPTKAKVLYDSKVLEVIENKDKRGRRTVEYLIHFQGWNSSWDRCVSEDFVLKDTEENRQLQRDLAEKSQLQLGAYLYRRERKKGSTSSAGPPPSKRARQGFSDDGSSSSTQPDDGGTEGEGDAEESGDSDSSSESGNRRPRYRLHTQNIGRASITLPSALRDRLTFDYHLITKRGRLARLPASPSAAHILESFVKWFARAGAWHVPRVRHDPPPRPDLLDVSCRLNLVREIADGLRVYFDFVLGGHLLYKQEQEQYYLMCGQYITEQEKKHMKEEPYDEDAESQDDQDGEDQEQEQESGSDDNSPRLPEYSHLPPDPDQPAPEQDEAQEENTENQEENETEEIKTEIQTELKTEIKQEIIEEPQEENDEQINEINPEINEIKQEVQEDLKEDIKVEVKEEYIEKPQSEQINEEPEPEPRMELRPATRSGNARRLRSHKAASKEEEEVPSTSQEKQENNQQKVETHSSSVGSSGSSVGESWPRSAVPAPAPTTRTPISLLLDKVAKWQIIPREGTEHLPCRVYGAIHLARLFVKLPDFLNATPISDFKLKLVLKHVDMFVQYLNEHSEWFGEKYYVSDNISKST